MIIHTEIQVWMKRIFWYKLAEVGLNNNIGQKTWCCCVYIFVTLNALIQLLLKRNHLTRKNSLLLSSFKSASFCPNWTKYFFLSSIMDRICLAFFQQQYHILQSFLGFESGQIFFIAYDLKTERSQIGRGLNLRSCAAWPRESSAVRGGRDFT